MKRITKQVFCVAGVMVVAHVAAACLWDYDTLAMEKRVFPEALDLMTGKFLRHSAKYYEWRILDRTEALKRRPASLTLYDDLAVAYDKTGQNDKAIEVILKKAALKPRLYSTEANLGTFYIHSGQFEKGLEHIKKAIEINPDAHFGREIYQKRLVEYVLSKQVEGKLSLPIEKESIPYGGTGFAKFVLAAAGLEKAHEKHEAELSRAEKGILGMMRFGHHDSPVLLEALGDILLSKGDAKRLASRAYLKASYESKDPVVKRAYRKKATMTLGMQTKHKFTTTTLTIAELEKTFTKELKDAASWYAKLLADEKKWQEKEANMDDEFSVKYYKHTRQTGL